MCVAGLVTIISFQIRQRSKVIKSTPDSDPLTERLFQSHFVVFPIPLILEMNDPSPGAPPPPKHLKQF